MKSIRKKSKIDWKSLEKGWSEDYENDYIKNLPPSDSPPWAKYSAQSFF